MNGLAWPQQLDRNWHWSVADENASNASDAITVSTTHGCHHASSPTQLAATWGIPLLYRPLPDQDISTSGRNTFRIGRIRRHRVLERDILEYGKRRCSGRCWWFGGGARSQVSFGQVYADALCHSYTLQCTVKGATHLRSEIVRTHTLPTQSLILLHVHITYVTKRDISKMNPKYHLQY